MTEPHANGLHRSTDGGESFPLVAQSSPSSTGLHFQTSALFPDPADDEVIAVQSYIDGLTIIDARTRTMRTGRYHYWDSAIWSPVPGVMYLTTRVFEPRQLS